MRPTFFLAAFIPFAHAQTPATPPGLPLLRAIKTATLSPSYSCRSKQEFDKGYGNTALFLSTPGVEVNSPDLLFNGACGSENYFDVSLAGDEMSLIADLGAVPIEQVTAQKAFHMMGGTMGRNFSRFALAAKVEQGHTYAVVVNQADRRGLFVFTVDEYVPDRKVVIRYDVKNYQIIQLVAQSAGFDWGK
jgi:hypothetical protein